MRTVEVPAPGSVRQVLDLLSLLEALPFDPDRSPWDVTLIHGVEGGGAALFLRAHHVLTDGIGGVRLLQDLFDRDDEVGAACRPAGSRRAPETDDPSRSASSARSPST